MVQGNKIFDHNMNLISTDRTGLNGVNNKKEEGVHADEIYQTRVQFLKELKALESQYELKMKERSKEILTKVKEEYKPLIQDLKSNIIHKIRRIYFY